LYNCPKDCGGIFGTVIGEKGIDDREEKRYDIGAVIRFGFYSKEL
jgi:hypothetical protein